MKEMWPWITLALLGAYHGINPGMGWLFAVALGLQERKRSAVVKAFAPIAIGHFVSIAIVVGLVAMLQTMVPAAPLKYAGAAALVAYGLYKLLAPMSHPRWVGMRINSGQLALWSFLMATAHGAGLMVVPIVLKLPAGGRVVEASDGSTQEAVIRRLDAVESRQGPVLTKKESGGTTQSTAVTPGAADCHTQVGKLAAGSGMRAVAQGLAAVSIHTLAMFLAMAGIAVIVYEKVGLAILRKAWFNLDLLWAAALIGAGLITALI